MRRIQMGLLTAVFVAMTVLAGAVGCGGLVDRDDEPLRVRKQGGGQFVVQREPPLLPVKGDYKGVIKGVVKWAGADKDFAAINAKFLENMKQDRAYCTAASDAETTDQSYRVGKNKQLGNVFVWIAPADSKHAFEVPADQMPKQKDVVLSQPHCAFMPHCVAVFAARYDFAKGELDAKGCQDLIIQNDAKVGHNASVKGGPLNGSSKGGTISAWSGTGAPSKAVIDLKPERDAIKVSCNVHPWMSAYVWVFDHPYFAISSVGADLKDPKHPRWIDLDSDKVGTFEIKNVPIGAEVRLFAWHEDLGHLLGKNGQKMKLEAMNEVPPIEAK